MINKVMMQGQTTIPANDKVSNILDGERYENAPFNAVGALYICGSAAGLYAELNVGGSSVTPPVVVNAQNRVPQIPDDMATSGWLARKQSLIQMTVSNTTVGDLDAFWKIELQYYPTRRQ